MTYQHMEKYFTSVINNLLTDENITIQMSELFRNTSLSGSHEWTNFFNKIVFPIANEALAKTSQ